ncbi:TIGR03086 family metal-binding protein [Nonomuraea basaltis]|uniref:TIGR03086 family metal-binding protein n=1 Tax=Nonomuraea basaltis TaxID=2495887 RepID=UPI00110C4686|nr:TIGR03086 family metal-binding protein [Nonomuraea basaltis]TMR93694.1 TIGR03086 family protein [Nonomuraea basaltis]
MGGGPGMALTAGVALLERAINYTLGSLRVVTPGALCRPTPCAGWSLETLLDHVNDALRMLNEAASGDISLGRLARKRAACGGNPALLLRDDATEVLGIWAGTLTDDVISIHDRHLTSPIVAAVGAIELAVHGWDVARTCGEHRPIPPLMAEELLDLAQLFVTQADRPDRFAAQVTVPSHAPAQDHLLAYLGRDPTWPSCPDLGT